MRLPLTSHGSNNHRWNGGKTIYGGYPATYTPDHPRADSRGYVRDHILIAEKALGKPLPLKAVPHHVDGNRLNNANSNLVICEDTAYHAFLHARMRAKAATGNANSLKCRLCKKWSLPNDPRIRLVQKKSRRPTPTEAYHRDCMNKYQRELKRAQELGRGLCLRRIRWPTKREFNEIVYEYAKR